MYLFGRSNKSVWGMFHSSKNDYLDLHFKPFTDINVRRSKTQNQF